MCGDRRLWRHRLRDLRCRMIGGEAGSLSSRWRGGDELVETDTEVVDGDLKIRDTLVYSGLPGFEFVLRDAHRRHRGLDLDEALLVLFEHLEDTVELLVGLHGGLQTRLVVVERQDRVSDTRCYRTTTGEVGIVGDMVELDGSDSQATADYRPCQRRRLALGSV